MTIYWGKKVTLWVDWWRTRTWMSYLLTLLICFLVSAFHQYMEERRLHFKASAYNSSPITTPLLSKLGRTRRVSPARLVTSIMFGVNLALGYLLMLAIMSCNGGVFLAILLGLSFGYYLFRSRDDWCPPDPCAWDFSCFFHCFGFHFLSFVCNILLFRFRAVFFLLNKGIRAWINLCFNLRFKVIMDGLAKVVFLDTTLNRSSIIKIAI